MSSYFGYFECDRGRWFTIRRQINIAQTHSELTCGKPVENEGMGYLWKWKPDATPTYGLWRESRVQWAAVSTYFEPIKEPPHQNSTRLSPCRKIAANHGQSPLSAATPPTTRPEDCSCCPHWLSSTKFPFNSLMPLMPINGFGGRDIVGTGTRSDGRFVVVGMVGSGVSTSGGRCVKNVGRWVVKCVVTSLSIGQQTPGMNRRLKHRESRRPAKSSNSPGQTLKSSHLPAWPFGVMQRFSPSLPSISSIWAAKHKTNIFQKSTWCDIVRYQNVPGATVEDDVAVVSFFGCTAWCFFRFFSANAAISIFSLNDCLSIFDSFCGSLLLWLVPTRLINGSIVLVIFWPSTVFVSVNKASGTLCCVDDDSTTSESSSSLMTAECDGNFVVANAGDSIDDEIKCISPRWCWSPFAPRVIFTRKLPTVFSAPSVSEMREKADWDSRRAWSSLFWRLLRRTFGNGNTSSSERNFTVASSMRREAITTPASSSTSPSSAVNDGRCSWLMLANAGGKWTDTFFLSFKLNCTEKSVCRKKNWWTHVFRYAIVCCAA